MISLETLRKQRARYGKTLRRRGRPTIAKDEAWQRERDRVRAAWLLKRSRSTVAQQIAREGRRSAA